MVKSLYRQIRIQILIIKKYLRRNWKVFLISLLLLIITILLGSKLNLLSLNANTVSEGFIGTYQAHDLPDPVLKLLSQGLVTLDQTGRVKPQLAEKWEVNSDATNFKFRLKDNLKWADGTLLKSTDLSFKIEDVEVSYPDEKTINFKLKNAYSPFPTLLTKPLLKKDSLVGMGPYKIATCRNFFIFPRPCVDRSKIFITKIILEPNQSDLPKVVVRFYPNEKTGLTAFSVGEVQSLVGIHDLDSARKNPQADFLQLDSLDRLVAIYYNTKDSVLSNRSLRQALSYSTPRIENEKEAKTPFAPTSWAYTDQVNDYKSNMDSAQAALKRAKASTSQESLKKEIVLTTTPQFESLGRRVVKEWQALGLKAVLRIESGIPQNFQALLIAQTIPEDQYSLWHSTQTKTNLTKYASARVDKDLEDARKLLKEEDRKLKYIDFQKTLLEDSPATFLYFPKVNVIFFKKVDQKLEKVLKLQYPQ